MIDGANRPEANKQGYVKFQTLETVKCDHRSKFSNLSNWKEEAWKNSGLERDSNPWPPRYRCDALPTELWSHTVGARSIYWVHIFPCSEIMWNIYEIIHSQSSDYWRLHSSVGRASHRYRGGHGFESRWSPDYFQASSFQLFTLENLLRWSHFTFIYNRSTNMNYFIYISH